MLPIPHVATTAVVRGVHSPDLAVNVVMRDHFPSQEMMLFSQNLKPIRPMT
ncbi:hypothetical protein Y88_0131 [Novosphingobium nitrogenifigens DSM 19370]|uniref:Uncharacterized protein n=1 Tax=Novosphingobium nitrogenifigens DSM 19370 TaxID=983920 RepID=F1ZB54_9SPHN|nr:hypothetical protein Y88_0131 [Novosphingobium nitrogenifigens DSM 19370]